MLTLYAYRACSTCRRAEKWLQEHQIDYNPVSVKTANLQTSDTFRWQKLSNLPLKRFFNTSGQVYRRLNLKDKLATLTEDEQRQILISDGMLLKRPILVAENFVLVGFQEAEWAAKLDKLA